ncbi:MAG TPA: Fe-S cluster assembly protein SufD [Gemmatimonadaceae bacterium]|nr:Fe-S cluster assembly protein SufD [Gemmatimonadaceae bacterium]
MSTTQWQSAFAIRANRDEPQWLSPMRRTAMESFNTLGFPTPALEDWHYTSLASIADVPFTLAAAPSTTTVADLTPYMINAEWPTVVLLNGVYSPSLSSIDSLPAGVRVMELAQAWREHADLVQQHLGKVATGVHALTALNTGLMQDGVLVYLPKDVATDTPIHILHVADAAAATTAKFPRTLIVAERFAKGTVLESFVSLADVPYFTNHVAEVVVGENATLTHTKIQRESELAVHVSTTEVHQARDSHYVNFSVAMGARVSRTNVYTVLDGENCGATLNGLYLGKGVQHTDHQTRIEHAQPNCFSRELYKGVLDDASRAVFNGKVYVHPIAQKTDGKQSNHTLLLSPDARIDTKPQLEIFADDVKCTHGATVGRMDEAGLFYMKSRGVPAETARRLLTYAFAADVLETIENETVKQAMELLTLERYAGSSAATAHAG